MFVKVFMTTHTKVCSVNNKDIVQLVKLENLLSQGNEFISSWHLSAMGNLGWLASPIDYCT